MVQWSMTPVAISCDLYHQSQVQSSPIASFTMRTKKGENQPTAD
jgi:hypothetical protein